MNNTTPVNGLFSSDNWTAVSARGDVPAHVTSIRFRFPRASRKITNGKEFAQFDTIHLPDTLHMHVISAAERDLFVYR
jgi:hypothetical protein